MGLAAITLRFLFPSALDVALYGIQFEGMKLAGLILISVGFFLVMFPDNWPDYIMRLLRYVAYARSSTLSTHIKAKRLNQFFFQTLKM